jgi:myo-inositol-1(or 4)-monophosphatase
MGLSPWDVAAGGLLILESGGLITDFSGEGDYLHAGTVVAGTPKLFPQLLAIVQAHK